MTQRLLSLAALFGLLLLPLAAHAQPGVLEVAMRDSSFSEDGAVELVVNVTGSAKPDVVAPEAFTVTENGEPVEGLEVTPLLEAEETLVVTSLVLDISTSMDGEPLERIQDAAIDTVATLTGQDIPVGLLAFESVTHVLSAPTLDAEELNQLIAGLEATGRTALFDAVIEGVDQLASVEGLPNLVVFADGEDNESEATFDDAVAAAVDAEVPVIVVAFETERFEPDTVAPLADETGGRLMTAADTDEFGAVFDDVATDIASQYVLAYSGENFEADNLDVQVDVEIEGSTADASFTVPNHRQADATQAAPTPVTRTPSQPGLFASSTALYAGVGAAFLALLAIFGLMFTGQRTTGDRVLAGQLERYIKHGDQRAGRSGLVGTHFRERAMEFLESTPRPKGYDERLRRRLEQAAWPLRNSEFLLMSVGAGVVALVITGFAFNWPGGVLIGIVAASGPWIVLEVRRSRRQDAFLRNLPDTLQLMAGSLRAGYGVLQALDSVAKESTGPAAEEFQRVITEARLGMAVEDALQAMADRIDSDDFRWVVLAINIQREVGGNLAELLDTVAETLREREMLRRQISVLSAEGRLSAIILIALPIVLTIYLILVRPDYIGALVTSGLFGWMLVGGASVLMLIGVVWIRKMIQIEV